MKKRLKINKGVIILSLLLAFVTIYCVVWSVIMSAESKKIQDICESYLDDFAKCVQTYGKPASCKKEMRETFEKYFTDDEEITKSIFDANDNYYDYMDTYGISLSSCEMKVNFKRSDIVFEGFNKAKVSLNVEFSYVVNGKRVTSDDSYYGYYYNITLEKSNGRWYIMYADSMYDTRLLIGGVN